MNSKEHWEKVYSTKSSGEVSWYQQEPKTSLAFFKELAIPKDAAIIDVGGGDSNLVDYLLNKGYGNITVLDVSEKALEKTKNRLGEKAGLVNWVIADVNSFESASKFDVWHDRALLHFLNDEAAQKKYLEIANKHLNHNAKIIIGTFSDEGPEKCSGLPVKRYNENSLSNLVKNYFKKIKCITTDHITPFNTIQHFLFCSFLKTS
ncbi:MAG: class I SAM-dependent methyltransferase [Sphingobacteriales bacterium]